MWGEEEGGGRIYESIGGEGQGEESMDQSIFLSIYRSLLNLDVMDGFDHWATPIALL